MAQQVLFRVIGVLIPILFLFGYIAVIKWQRARKNIRVPVKDKLLRPPGESLRKKLEDLTFDFVAQFGLIMLVSTVGAITFPVPVNPFLTTFYAVVLAGLFWKIVQTAREAANYRLGFSGERLVGEELNRLAAENCYVFHDFPADPKWNIDHIVVAPSGVYAIETKTRRKRKAPQGKEDHKVIFDGEFLNFPHGRDKWGITQARNNAAWLSDFLSKATADPVKVTPILTFPGWYIELKAPSDFPIINPKSMRSIVVTNRPEVLDNKTRKRIAHQIEQKCRDVEF